ncbi:MAG: DUF368 domain-containing protein [Halanaeroarchaeum sp.]
MMASRELLTVYLKGFAMGAADAIPGVSGGTIALITGIYDRLVGSIAALKVATGLALLGDLRSVHHTAARRRVLDRVRSMDLPFLLTLGFGIVTAALTAANVLEWAVGVHAGPTYAFFFGLIVASAYVLRDAVVLDSAVGWAVAVAGVVLAFVASGSFEQGIGDGYIVLFGSGIVGISAMVLPGISGSLILLTLGQYETIITAVDRLTHATFAGSASMAVSPLVTLLVFAAGALLGILSFARVVSWALERYRTRTMTFLVALMIGALRAPAIRIAEATGAWSPSVALVLVGWGLLGALAVIALDRMTDEIAY